MIFEDFEENSYNGENESKQIIFKNNTYSLKIIHRNCAFKLQCPSIGTLVKKFQFNALFFPLRGKEAQKN